jgi:DNA-binding PadR family transcriptional regulator
MERSPDPSAHWSDDRPRRGGPRRRHEGFGGPRGRGRMKRGDIRTAVLAVLTDDAAHGYEIIQVIEARSEGAWRPSPGSVYPTLQLLEDEGMVRSTEREGKRVFEITDAGRTEAAERIEQAGGAPWDAASLAGGRHGELKRAVGQLMLAARQVGATGSPDQVERAAALLSEARKGLYGILAED